MIFHKQFDNSLAFYIESILFSPAFSPLRRGERAVFLPLDILPQLRYTVSIRTICRSERGGFLVFEGGYFSMTQQDRTVVQYHKMTETPIPRLIIRLETTPTAPEALVEMRPTKKVSARL